MNIQIKEIAIYSKDKIKKRVVPFEAGKLNIIHGASQTGKSAIIPIIDYCLCSSVNRIPVGKIRDNCSAFAINLKFDDLNLLIKRFSDQNENVIYYAYSEKSLDEISDDEWQQTSLLKFKLYLNNQFGISSSEIADDDENSEENKKVGKPSFRDLISFNFQPQNIVANPNCLLYKTDIYKYRYRLQKIFDYAIGAQTSEQLYDDIRKQELELELKGKEREKENLRKYNEKLLIESEPLLYKAIEYGLIENRAINMKDPVLVTNLLTEIADKKIADVKMDEESNNIAANKIQNLIQELDEKYFELRALKQERNNIGELIGLEDEYTKQLEEKKSRLEIARFIRNFCIENKKDTDIIKDVDELYNNLIHIEHTLVDRNLFGKSVYESKYRELTKKINNKSLAINTLLKSKNLLEEKIKGKSILEEIYVKIIGKAQKIIALIKDENELQGKIDEINLEIKKYVHDIGRQRGFKLNSIVNKSNSYVPKFAEFDEISEFKNDDLTVKVKNKNEKIDYYLWETGSGSNWVAYHIANLLGFQKHFISIKSPVFNFLIFDQPSQVYFPKLNYVHTEDFNYSNEAKEEKKDKGMSDLECVQEMFKIMSRAIEDNKPIIKTKETDDQGNEIVIEEKGISNLQIIILDHAGETVWKDIEGINDVNPLDEWTTKNPLVPLDWIK